MFHCSVFGDENFRGLTSEWWTTYLSTEHNSRLSPLEILHICAEHHSLLRSTNTLCSLWQALGVPVDRLVKAADSVSVCFNLLISVFDLQPAYVWLQLTYDYGDLFSPELGMPIERVGRTRWISHCWFEGLHWQGLINWFVILKFRDATL